MKHFKRALKYGAVPVAFAGSASAAVPTEITDFFTTLTTDFGVMTPLIAGLVTVVVGFFMVVDWGKKGARKAK